MAFHHPFQETQFDIFDWYPEYQACRHFFHHHAQHTNAVQAVAANINIQLPFQKNKNSSDPASSPNSGSGSGSGSGSTPSQSSSSASASASPSASTAADASLVPYIRRLVATGFDSPSILHGFFGDDWAAGVGAIHENERRNYLFAAKSETWLRVKASYDMEHGQTIPFLRPLQGASEKEIQAAEASWSEWLAMQDWMLGPRAPRGNGPSSC